MFDYTQILYPGNQEEIENKPNIYRKIDEIIAEYWFEVEKKNEMIKNNEIEIEEGEEGKDFVNVWLYYVGCKRVCGLHKFWLSDELYREYTNYITDKLEI